MLIKILVCQLSTLDFHVNTFEDRNIEKCYTLIDVDIIEKDGEYVTAIIKFKVDEEKLEKQNRRIDEVQELIDYLGEYQCKKRIHLLARFKNNLWYRITRYSARFCPDRACTFDDIKYMQDDELELLDGIGKKTVPVLKDFIDWVIEKRQEVRW